MRFRGHTDCTKWTWWRQQRSLHCRRYGQQVELQTYHGHFVAAMAKGSAPYHVADPFDRTGPTAKTATVTVQHCGQLPKPAAAVKPAVPPKHRAHRCAAVTAACSPRVFSVHGLDAQQPFPFAARFDLIAMLCSAVSATVSAAKAGRLQRGLDAVARTCIRSLQHSQLCRAEQQW